MGERILFYSFSLSKYYFFYLWAKEVSIMFSYKRFILICLLSVAHFLQAITSLDSAAFRKALPT